MLLLDRGLWEEVVALFVQEQLSNTVRKHLFSVIRIRLLFI